ncbi:macro domain-containing protein [candidate division KSB1 bacterium]
MADTLKINNSSLRLMKGDYTDFEIESIVYYAQNDLKLGAGFGNAISMRGGPSIQEELDKNGTMETTEAVVSAAGEMKTNHIIHAVGPKFQEADLEDKLEKTIFNCLKKADENGIKAIAFPPMGCGFYGVPLDVSADIMYKVFNEYLTGDTGIEEIVICLNDNREFIPFQERLDKIQL